MICHDSVNKDDRIRNRRSHSPLYVVTFAQFNKNTKPSPNYRRVPVTKAESLHHHAVVSTEKTPGATARGSGRSNATRGRSSRRTCQLFEQQYERGTHGKRATQCHPLVYDWLPDEAAPDPVRCPFRTPAKSPTPHMDDFLLVLAARSTIVDGVRFGPKWKNLTHPRSNTKEKETSSGAYKNVSTFVPSVWWKLKR